MQNKKTPGKKKHLAKKKTFAKKITKPLAEKKKNIWEKN